jgi:hypothetical protein
VHTVKAYLQKFKDDKTLCLESGVLNPKEGKGAYQDLLAEM